MRRRSGCSSTHLSTHRQAVGTEGMTAAHWRWSGPRRATASMPRCRRRDISSVTGSSSSASNAATRHPTPVLSRDYAGWGKATQAQIISPPCAAPLPLKLFVFRVTGIGPRWDLGGREGITQILVGINHERIKFAATERGLTGSMTLSTFLEGLQKTRRICVLGPFS
jgi:hypothetical protein